MIRRYIVIFLLLSTSLHAQYANSWINFNGSQPYSAQQYFKIKVWKNGIYRLDYNILQQAGFPVNINPQQYQIFLNGKEQYIYVAGENDGTFDPSDYIEFYGKPNDGKIDRELYEDPSDQLNADYSLFCDTAVYFLTAAILPGTPVKRMILENDVNFQAYSPLDFVYSTIRKNFTSEYLKGDSHGDVDPSYAGPEGFSGTPFSATSVADLFATPNLSSSPLAPPPVMDVRMVNANFDGYFHTFNVLLNNNTVFSNSSIFGYTRYDFNFTLSPSSLLVNNTIQFSGSSNGPGTNRMSVTYYTLRYAHAPSFSGETTPYQFFSVSGNGNKLRTDLSDYLNSDNTPRYIYVISGDSVSRVTTVRTGNLLQALIPVNNNEKYCMLAAASATFASTSDFYIQPVNIDADPQKFARFINYSFNQPQYDYLIVSHKKLWTEAQNYRDFRALTGFNPLLTDIDDLYDQFAYGIYKHPLSIKNFCRFALAAFNNKPDYLFLIGKAVYPEEVRLNTLADQICLVPTYGNPASDFMFSNKITDTTYVPRLATGRLAAQNVSDVANYLAKAQAHEAARQNCPDDWLKQVLHFIGGNNGFEQQSIKAFMDQNEAAIRDTFMGCTVTNYYKISTDPIQYIQALELQARIDSGVSVMTFFGHAAGSTFDIATDIPQNWHNAGRYPVVFAQSCNVGDIFSRSRQLNEDFVLLPQKGSVGFLAKPSLGNIQELGDYSLQLYRNISYRDYDKPLGMAIKHAADSLIHVYYLNQGIPYKSTALGMQWHGDPGIRLAPSLLTDYEITQPSITFQPAEVTSDLTTFTMKVVVKNLGKVSTDSVTVRVIRKFPDNSNLIVDTLLKYIPYNDTLSIVFEVDVNKGAGFNYFDVFVDYAGTIAECNELNNRVLNIPLQILSTDITPVYPFKYAIVPDASVILKATTDNIYAPQKTYRFEIDTTDAFNSPFLRTKTFTQSGGVIKWPLPFSCDSGKVYYWRVSLDPSLYPSNYKWKESSFIYIPQKTGWSQAHYFQFKNDSYNNIVYNKPNRKWDYDNTQAELRVSTWDVPGQGATSDNVQLNNQLIATGGCNYRAIYAVVLDSISLQTWNTVNYAGSFGNINQPPYYDSCQAIVNGGQTFFAFATDSVYSAHGHTIYRNLDSLANFINRIPTGNYVILYSVTEHSMSRSWSGQFRFALSQQGINNVDTIPDSKHFIFFFKKGFPNTAQTVVAAHDSIRNITFTTFIGGNWYKGFVTSEMIGPAIQWNSLHWAHNSLENPSADSLSLDIIGVDTANAEQVLYSAIQPAQADFNLNINPYIYPRIYLRVFIEDSVFRTPAQLSRWQIYYQEVPEAVINPIGSEFLSANLSQGDTVFWKMGVENISTTDMSDLLVDYFLYDKDNVRRNIASPRFRALLHGDTLNASVRFSTTSYPGLNALWMEVNPRNDQPEQYHFNNFAKIAFNVNRDVTNPILDVTFDGQHILNGDIVSAKPQILIKLKDENRYLALNDTSKYKIYIKNPSGQEQQLYFEPVANSSISPGLLKWTPAQLPENIFRIEYNPIFADDGIYELRAQARDESGNLSGSNEYRISFEVINKSSITNVFNYPNPFTTRTQFVFTLTGSEIPTYFKIQIINISGKVVKEISQQELGLIRIGRNITDYAWDGRDEFGDQLAKGVYLYRVIIKINDSDIEHRTTAADKYFGKGWGKMYLLK
jgi:hypothetical protein